MYFTLAAIEFQNNEIDLQDNRAGILKQSMGARKRAGIGLSYPYPLGYIGWQNQLLAIIYSWAP
jgi:hypothetical protein